MKFKLNIPEPCHEDWQQMSPTQKGKFCASCQKEVIDFTKLSATEIARKTKNAKQLCGRFTSTQLEQDYVSTSQSSLSRLGIALGLGSIITVAQPGLAQEKRPTQESVLNLNSENEEEEKIDVVEALNNKMPICGFDEVIIITGNVTEETGLPLPGVNIIQQNTSNGTQTDFDGNFSIEISEEDFENEVFLQFSYVGFETVQVKINSEEKNQTLKLELSPGEALEGEVVIIRTNIFQRFLNLFRSNENKRY
ncbi:MAG: carboxypeptidase-like regulatory domain-containing protein [Mesonia sp.]|uniref:carboxypeptidase-like regulatory domain-containing protein n=1 Tax=Mesonia sp. TaxID=1960830 RepID=UPI003241CE11